MEERVTPASHTWSGASNGLWSNAANWSAGGVPTSVETGVILNFGPTSGANIKAMTNDIAGLNVDQINFTVTGYTLVGFSSTVLNLTGNSSPAISDTVGGNAINATNLTLNLNGSSAVSVGAGTVTIAAPISGSAGNSLTKTGPGALMLSGNSTYSGVTNVNFGTLNIQNSNALGSTTNGTVVASGAKLQLQGGITVPAGESLTISQPAAPSTFTYSSITNGTATTGTATSNGVYTFLTFTTTAAPGTLISDRTATLNGTSAGNVDYLIVAGGGGGGPSVDGGWCAGGGGAGGMLEVLGYSFSGTSTSVVIGAGGSGGVGSTGPGTAPTNGQNSSFNGIAATGGGRGGFGFDSTTPGSQNGGTGGSGGGSGSAGVLGVPGNGISLQGNNGGTAQLQAGGGGGGALSAGGNASGSTAGAGGAGKDSTITGLTYAGGGGGAFEYGAGAGAAGGAGGGGDGGNGGPSATQTDVNGKDGTNGLGGGGGAGVIQNTDYTGLTAKCDAAANARKGHRIRPATRTCIAIPANVARARLGAGGAIASKWSPEKHSNSFRGLLGSESERPAVAVTHRRNRAAVAR